LQFAENASEFAVPASRDGGPSEEWRPASSLHDCAKCRGYLVRVIGLAVTASPDRIEIRVPAEGANLAEVSA
jgi:hypothetical protein